MPKENTLRTILARCEIDETTGTCWTWLKKPNSTGYGNICYKSEPWLLHRLIYTLLVSPISDDMVLHHVCRNRLCCNPRHLEPMTASEHTRLEDNISTRNKAKTCCSKGHPLVGDNAVPIPPNQKMPTGGRYCRTCKRATVNAYRQRKKLKEGRICIVNAEKTHCVHGHEFSPENTRIHNNKRACITCNRNRAREHKRQKRADKS